MQELLTTDGLLSLLTLTILEIILGVDNVIFIAIVCSALPRNQQNKARTAGVMLALVARLILLGSITWMTQLDKKPLISILSFDFTTKDLILFCGGLFLIAKSISEIHNKFESKENIPEIKKLSIKKVVFQIILIDIIFSFDSILTAVGLSRSLPIMALAVIFGLFIMIFFAKVIGEFVENHPTVKMLALSFLVLIGFLLIVESFGEHVPKGYVYFAITFSVSVEFLNMKLRKSGTKHPIADQSKQV